MREALIVVDMQNDFLAKGGYYDRKQNEKESDLAQPSLPQEFRPRDDNLAIVVENVCKAIARARARQLPIAYLRAVYGHSFNCKPRLLQENRCRRNYPCKSETWGARIIDPISDLLHNQTNNVNNEIVLDKHTFNGFFKTGLRQFLRNWEIDAVLIAGVESHICVLTTAQSASFNQFKTIILRDCVWTAKVELAQSALDIFCAGFGDVKYGYLI